MKKIAILVLVILAITFLFTTFLLAERDIDIQTIKKAVKQNPAYQSGKEVKWFKVLITDNRTEREKVRITLPISLVEIFIKCADDRHLRINRQECDVNLKEVFKELKKLGPMALIEIYEEDETVKILLE